MENEIEIPPLNPEELRDDIESLKNLLLQLENIERWLMEKVRPNYRPLVDARKSNDHQRIEAAESTLQKCLDGAAHQLIYTGNSPGIKNLINQLNPQLNMPAFAFDLVQCMLNVRKAQIEIAKVMNLLKS